jgi:hypothetical protein
MAACYGCCFEVCFNDLNTLQTMRVVSAVQCSIVRGTRQPVRAYALLVAPVVPLKCSIMRSDISNVSHAEWLSLMLCLCCCVQMMREAAEQLKASRRK